MNYKHTQIGYLILAVTLVVLVLFGWAHITARAEPPSYDSGTNLAVTAIMTLIIFILASFVSLQVVIDEKYLRIKFGYGIYQKKFFLNDVLSAKTVKNHWYYGWGIRGWLWPKMCIYNVSGLDAVEIKLNNGKTYRIGTDEPRKLEQAIQSLLTNNNTYGTSAKLHSAATFKFQLQTRNCSSAYLTDKLRRIFDFSL